MCFNFTFEQFLSRHNISGWKIISKQSQTNSSSETKILAKEKVVNQQASWSYLLCQQAFRPLGKESG